MTTLEVHLKTAHPMQREFIESPAQRKVCRAGRRGGKTTGAALLAIESFLKGHRILYATPTQEQVETFWWEVTQALAEPIDAGAFYKNETRHVIERPHTKQRIRAKTAWNADSLRGDFADLLILDEFQLMNEDAWELVGAPMLLDNDGAAVFIYTPPSLRTVGRSKARDPRHASKMYRRAQDDTSGRWRAFHFTSHDNPYISKAALADITQDMSRLSYEQEIMAEDKDVNPDALWKRDDIDNNRVLQFPGLARLVVGVDPTATSTGDEAGIVATGSADGHYYVLEDASQHGTPQGWASAAVALYHKLGADRIVAEANNGGEMVSAVIGQIAGAPPVKLVHASRGKATRAEPVVALYEQNRVHHVGNHPALEEEMVMWGPGDASPNRMDALVWSITELMTTATKMKVRTVESTL